MTRVMPVHDLSVLSLRPRPHQHDRRRRESRLPVAARFARIDGVGSAMRDGGTNALALAAAITCSVANGSGDKPRGIRRTTGTSCALGATPPGGHPITQKSRSLSRPHRGAGRIAERLAATERRAAGLDGEWTFANDDPAR